MLGTSRRPLLSRTPSSRAQQPTGCYSSCSCVIKHSSTSNFERTVETTATRETRSMTSQCQPTRRRETKDRNQRTKEIHEEQKYKFPTIRASKPSVWRSTNGTLLKKAVELLRRTTPTGLGVHNRICNISAVCTRSKGVRSAQEPVRCTDVISSAGMAIGPPRLVLSWNILQDNVEPFATPYFLVRACLS